MKKLGLICLGALGFLTSVWGFVACNTSGKDEAKELFTFENTDGGYAVCGVGEFEKGKIEIPSVYKNKAVVAIADGAFAEQDGLVTVVLPDSLKTIGAGAFSGCGHLKNVSFGGVESIGENAFEDCVSIKELTLPEKLQTIESLAFTGCLALKKLDLPDGVKNVGESAFTGCAALTELTVGSGLETIGKSAFEGNAALLYVTVDGAPLSIGDGAFLDCKNLLTADLGAELRYIGAQAFKGCSKLSEIVVGDECLGIGAQAFASCYHLTGVTLGEKVISVGESAFSSCYTLVEVYNRSQLSFVKGDETHGGIAKNVLNVCKSADGQKRFKDGDGVVYYKDGERVIVLGQVGAKTGLSLVFGDDDGVTEIYPMAFYNNLNVTNVTFQNTVKSIGKQAFNFCYKLRKIVLEDSVEEVGVRAFDRCSFLGNVILGANVKIIGENAFERNEELRVNGNVYYKGAAADFAKIQFAIGNDNLINAKRYYYSAVKPENGDACWYYDEDGYIRFWAQ